MHKSMHKLYAQEKIADKGLMEMYKSMTGGAKVNRNLFKIVKAGSILWDTPEINMLQKGSK